MKNKGVTLIELIIVISIIGILAVALGFSYVGWQGRYKVEKTTKDVYSDLMTARSLAMTRNRSYFVDFPTATTYRIAGDTATLNDWDADGDGLWDANADGVLDAVHTILPTFPKTISYTATWTGGTIVFDKRGIVQPSASSGGGTICFFTDNDPDYDCIVIRPTRILTGKIINQNNSCAATNCDEK